MSPFQWALTPLTHFKALSRLCTLLSWLAFIYDGAKDALKWITIKVTCFSVCFTTSQRSWSQDHAVTHAHANEHAWNLKLGIHPNVASKHVTFFICPNSRLLESNCTFVNPLPGVSDGLSQGSSLWIKCGWEPVKCWPFSCITVNRESQLWSWPELLSAVVLWREKIWLLSYWRVCNHGS